MLPIINVSLQAGISALAASPLLGVVATGGIITLAIIGTVHLWVKYTKD
jgi:hypothetical protein